MADYSTIFGEGVANTLSSAATGALNYMFGSKMMDKQWDYQKKMFNMQNERQNWLMLNSPHMMKEALSRAGYSTADPNATGVSTPDVSSGATPSMPGNMASDIRFDPMGAYAQLKQAQLAEMQSKGVEAEAKYKEALTEGQKITNQYIAPRSEAEVKQMLADIRLKKKQGKLTDVQADTAERLCKATENKTEAECRQIDQMIENAKEEYRRLGEQINLLRAQQQTERTVQGYNRAAAYAQYQAGELSHEAKLGQSWRNLQDEYLSGTRYLEQQQEQIKKNLREDLAAHGVDMDEHNILSLIGKQMVYNFHSGSNFVSNFVKNLNPVSRLKFK